jgi:uroporphyrinogen decarboxylase
MKRTVSRRNLINSMLAMAATWTGRNTMFAGTNKRDSMLNLLNMKSTQDYIPAAFFIHFDPSRHFGSAAVEKHLEYFRATNMDFVKIQYERTFPPIAEIKKPEDWGKMPSYKLDFYAPELEAVKGLVQAAKKEALVLVTLYSPFMCAGHTATLPLLTAHFRENPAAVKKGLEIITDSLLLFVKECIRLGVDGFYASTQGGEAGRFEDPRIFKNYIRPYDLVLMNEMNRACQFNILHVCDYNGLYADFSPFLDYPGHLVNCNPRLTTKKVAWKDIAQLFKRPCMGGLDRHGIIVTGQQAEIEKAVNEVLHEASQPFVLGADCTLPSDIPWENIRTAIAAAHAFRRS